MNKSIFFHILIVFVLTISCSKSNDEPNTPPDNIQVSTSNAENIFGTSAVVRGSVTSDHTPDYHSRGICWGKESNPTLQSNFYLNDSSPQNGSFSFKLNDLVPNTTYYARAYVQKDDTIIYGNQISFSTIIPTTTNFVSEITSIKATLNASIVQGDNEHSEVGFFYAEKPNVTVNDQVVPISGHFVGTDDFSIQLTNLKSNTVYYVKSYTKFNGITTLGDEVQFRTTGYFGPAGGYVAYDKGEKSDGWRYMEMHPETLNYNVSSGTGAHWGKRGQFISGTLPKFGSGLENSQIIAQNTTQANCAAKLCLNANINGFDDWFLPSIDELKLLAESIKNAGYGAIASNSWSSTQQDANNSMVLIYDTFDEKYEIYKFYNKELYSYKALPVRRY